VSHERRAERPGATDLRALLAEALHGRQDVRLAILFGSAARGRDDAGSDVDVGVIAPDAELLDLARLLSDAVGRQVDVARLEEASIPLTEQIVKDGVVVHQGVPHAEASFRTRALLMLETDGPWYRRMRDAWLARVSERGL